MNTMSTSDMQRVCVVYTRDMSPLSIQVEPTSYPKSSLKYPVLVGLASSKEIHDIMDSILERARNIGAI